ncbi:alpha-amylase family glycosyl hydrolase [Streptomyces luteolus]|uniref:Alpha-amylase family glycosyl hydrolase n=1 Tax=Streptomyces luteolus TaxID=3043615 RepID=A0ABT6STN0_9ACTN|nr:alpha-amylase family glycosyl hydrolase [Streptomyces sp. B-S-A12]MDI3418730.1 alpha-amylase family glycosyl hydrolase [Streptomyces sp. B-S-A12]
MTMRPAPPPQWLTDAVLYQIYPQSFADSNGDGIGDLAGITQRLDYLKWLGVTALWLNPCFTSPFFDAGYDVADYQQVAPRYGGNDDLVALIDAAHRRGMRVLLDLVAGHTSDQHPWFTASAAGTDGEYADRYIWTPSREIQPDGFHSSPGERDGSYLRNFFVSQPALNFGYARENPAEPWRQPPKAPGPRANREALRQVMAYWLDRGADGFRVDMASSLVKDDTDGTWTGELWREMRDWLDRRYPDAALVSEWGEPAAAVPAGFHLDFFLHFKGRAYRSLVDNAAGVQVPEWEAGPCYFDEQGNGSATEFLDAWDKVAPAIDGIGHVCLQTSNHDFPRLACGSRSGPQLDPAMVFMLTWPSVPSIYYGDEIGMRYVPDLPVKEGSTLGETYNRAGSRTPMQWDDGPNAGFSAGDPEDLYLPVDPDAQRPTVAAQLAERGSLLHLTRRLIALRRTNPAFGPRGQVEVLAGRDGGYPLVYLRSHEGQRFLVAVNPRSEAAFAALPVHGVAEPVLHRGAVLREGGVELEGFGYGVWPMND